MTEPKNQLKQDEAADDVAAMAAPDAEPEAPLAPEALPEEEAELPQLSGQAVAFMVEAVTPMFLRVGEGDDAVPYRPELPAELRAELVEAVDAVAAKHGGGMPPWLAAILPELRCAWVLATVALAIRAGHAAANEAAKPPPPPEPDGLPEAA